MNTPAPTLTVPGSGPSADAGVAAGRKSKGPTGYFWADPNVRGVSKGGKLKLVDQPQQAPQKRSCETIVNEGLREPKEKARQFATDFSRFPLGGSCWRGAAGVRAGRAHKTVLR
jgi:hypothetical protein